MTNFEWDIPTDDEVNLVLYAHTFASTLEPTKLANKDPLLQAETKIDVSQTPKQHKVGEEDGKDPYPWLDADDPRRKMTDEEILRLTVPFDKSILTAAEKERHIKLMLENTAAFSIRDEIGTCVTVSGHSPLSRPVAWRRSSSPIGLGYRRYASTHPLNALQMAALRAAI